MSVQNSEHGISMLPPFYSEKIRKRDTYRSLSLRSIHECRADGCREDNIAKPLLFKNSRSGLCSIECTVDIHVHNFLELFGGIFLGRMFRANSGIGHDDIQSSKVLDYLINGCRNFFQYGNIGLVGVNLCSIFRGELFRCFWSSCSCAIENGSLGDGIRFSFNMKKRKKCVAHNLAPASAYAVATV